MRQFSNVFLALLSALILIALRLFVPFAIALAIDHKTSGSLPSALPIRHADYPFDMGHYDVHALIVSVPGLSDEEQGLILGGNALRLLGLASSRTETH